MSASLARGIPAPSAYKQGPSRIRKCPSVQADTLLDRRCRGPTTPPGRREGGEHQGSIASRPPIVAADRATLTGDVMFSNHACRIRGS